MKERTYACSVIGSDFERDFVAASAGKARYQYFRHLRACDLEVPFTAIRARSLGAVTPRKTDYQQRCADESARVEDWNAAYPIGTPVRYWTGLREGAGKESRTLTEAHLLSGHTAVVWVEGEASCISLTHVEAMPKQPECMDCGEPATRRSADKVPLCDGDYRELCRQAGDYEPEPEEGTDAV